MGSKQNLWRGLAKRGFFCDGHRQDLNQRIKPERRKNVPGACADFSKPVWQMRGSKPAPRHEHRVDNAYIARHRTGQRRRVGQGGRSNLPVWLICTDGNGKCGKFCFRRRGVCGLAV